MELTNEKRLAAAFYLFTEPNVATAATKAGVSQATLYRWRKDPAFMAEMNDLRRAMVEQGMSKLQAATTMAAETLTAIIQDKAVAPSVRVKASQVQLLYSTRWLHMLEIIERLDRLEAKSAGKGDVIDASEYANFRYDAVESFGAEETGND